MRARDPSSPASDRDPGTIDFLRRAAATTWVRRAAPWLLFPALCLALSASLFHGGGAMPAWQRSLYAAGAASAEGSSYYDAEALGRAAMSRGVEEPLGPFLGSPALALAARALASQSPTEARWSWMILCVLLLGLALPVAVRAARELLSGDSRIGELAPSLFAAAAAAVPILTLREGLIEGRPTALAVLLLALALLAHARGRALLSGAALGLTFFLHAGALLPLLFVLARRRYRALAGFAAVLASVVVLSGAAAGFAAWGSYLALLGDVVSGRVDGLDPPSSLLSFSLLSFWARLHDDSRVFRPRTGERYRPDEYFLPRPKVAPPAPPGRRVPEGWSQSRRLDDEVLE